MYSTSTQKKEWTFSSRQEILKLRKAANERFRMRYGSVIAAGEEEMFLTPNEEAILCKIVTETGIRFSEGFRPTMWPSVRWTAFAYFKRFFLHHSTMEYSPKNIMMACFYLAAKVDEFNLSIGDFVANLQSGTAQSNSDTILKLEPEIMHKLKFHLTIHAPFRPFEGHLIDMKTRSLLGFDLEQVRPHSSEFFKKALFGDVMLLYPPSQIALAALKYALFRLDKSEDLLKDQFLYKLLNIETWQSQNAQLEICDKLLKRLDEIIECVLTEAQLHTKEEAASLHEKINRWVRIVSDLNRRLRLSQSDKTETNNSNNISDDD